jgi:hypothetical protein
MRPMIYAPSIVHMINVYKILVGKLVQKRSVGKKQILQVRIILNWIVKKCILSGYELNLSASH